LDIFDCTSVIAMDHSLCFKNIKLRHIDEVIDHYNSKEFRSPFRSTIPLLILYKNQPRFCFDILLNVDEASFCFEHETKVGNGRGRSSCTDLMIISPEACIAVEAKWTEPKYKTVEKWLGTSDNKKEVLEGWLEMIFKYAGVKVAAASILNLPYQLIHRVASACVVHRPKTYVIYLCFDLNESTTNYYNNILKDFSEIISKKVNLKVIPMRLNKLDEQENLEREWKSKRTRNVSARVVTGIKNNTLMRIVA
jgi:hypothetical protein